MEIIITSTDELTTIDGVEVRLWTGVTAAGTRCKVFVHRIAVHRDDDCGPFDCELKEQLQPGHRVPLSSIL